MDFDYHYDIGAMVYWVINTGGKVVCYPFLEEVLLGTMVDLHCNRYDALNEVRGRLANVKEDDRRQLFGKQHFQSKTYQNSPYFIP